MTAPAQYINDTLPSNCHGACWVGLEKFVEQHDRECNAQATVTHTYLSDMCICKCRSASAPTTDRTAIAPGYPCLRAFALLHDGKWSPLELLGLILDSSNDDADFANTHVHKVLR